MTDKELTDIGITSKAHRSALIEAIKKLPEPEIDPAVPVNFEDSACFTLEVFCLCFLLHIKIHDVLNGHVTGTRRCVAGDDWSRHVQG